jgi:hypothetical protein
VGTAGSALSAAEPSRLVPNAASSKSTSYVRPVCTSPIWNEPIWAAPTSTELFERAGRSTLSSHTWTVPVAVPADESTAMRSSTTCHPASGAMLLSVFVPSVSLWKPRNPVLLRYT